MPRRAADDGENVLIRFDRIKAETKKALLLDIDGEEVWIPTSQIAYIDDQQGEGEVWIPMWLADKKGLEYE